MGEATEDDNSEEQISILGFEEDVMTFFTEYLPLFRLSFRDMAYQCLRVRIGGGGSSSFGEG